MEEVEVHLKILLGVVAEVVERGVRVHSEIVEELLMEVIHPLLLH
jgi:hypothetical protein